MLAGAAAAVVGTVFIFAAISGERREGEAKGKT
jgi:hypothetical protein